MNRNVIEKAVPVRNRIVALQPHTDAVRVLFPAPASEPSYTAARGKWQLQSST